VARREGNPNEIHASFKPRKGAPLYCNCCGGPEHMRIDKRALEARFDPADFSACQVMSVYVSKNSSLSFSFV